MWCRDVGLEIEMWYGCEISLEKQKKCSFTVLQKLEFESSEMYKEHLAIVIQVLSLDTTVQ